MTRVYKMDKMADGTVRVHGPDGYVGSFGGHESHSMANNLVNICNRAYELGMAAGLNARVLPDSLEAR